MKSYAELLDESIAEHEAEIAAEEQAEAQRATELREKLAAYSHEAWAGWMKYMFSKGYYRALEIKRVGIQECWVMPLDVRLRWERQSRTLYADLPESEKASDRDEADKILAILA